MKRFYRLSALIYLIMLYGGAVHAQSIEDFYKVIRPAQPTQTENKVEVLEIFSYACPHCYSFEPQLQKWLQGMSDKAEFRRMPAVFRDDYIPVAKAYYTAVKLGVIDKIHQPLFDAIHKQRKYDLLEEDSLRDFFVEMGVNSDDFDRTFNSMEITTKIRQAEVMGKKYRIPHVPIIIINGKYMTSPSDAKSFETLFNVMDTLILQESSGS